MKFTLVLRYELVTLLRKPAFLILAIGLPVLGLLVLAGFTLTGSDSAAEETEQQISDELEVEGFVDLPGLIDQIPEEVPAGVLLEFDDEAAARQALEQGEIAAYYVVAADYLTSGEVQYIHPTVNPIGGATQDWMIRRTLVFNLVGGDSAALEQIWTPIDTEAQDLSIAEQGAEDDCSRPNANCESNEVISIMPTILMIMLFIVMTNGAGLLMRNISLEKQNRMIEILTSSLSPLQVMAGKIAGLGIATLIGFMVWVACSAAAIRLGVTTEYFPAGFAIPSGLLPWTLVFFLLGFALFGSLSAGVGALVPSLKESTQAAWLIIAPMMVGYMVGIFSVERPHSILMVVLSLFPITSPLVMVQRLSVGGVPLWQPFVAALLLALAVVLAVWMASRLFRAQNLLSGQRFSIGRLVRAVTG